MVKSLLAKHPYHTGFPLLSLVNADLDETPSASSAPKAKRQRVDPIDKGPDRMSLARDLFSEVCRQDRAGLFVQMQTLAKAYIEWANVDVESKRNSKGAFIFGCT